MRSRLNEERENKAVGKTPQFSSQLMVENIVFSTKIFRNELANVDSAAKATVEFSCDIRAMATLPKSLTQRMLERNLRNSLQVSADMQLWHKINVRFRSTHGPSSRCPLQRRTTAGRAVSASFPSDDVLGNL